MNDAPADRPRELARDDRYDGGFERGAAERAPDAPPPAFEPREPAKIDHEPVGSRAQPEPHAPADARERPEPSAQERHVVRESAPEPAYRPEPPRDAGAAGPSHHQEPAPPGPERGSAPHDNEPRPPPDPQPG